MNQPPKNISKFAVTLIQALLMLASLQASAQDNTTSVIEQRLVSRLQARGIPAEQIVLEPAAGFSEDDRPATIAFMRNYDVKFFHARITLQSGSLLLCSKVTVYSTKGDPSDIQKALADCAY